MFDLTFLNPSRATFRLNGHACLARHLLLVHNSIRLYDLCFMLYDLMSLRISLVDSRPFYHPGDQIQGNVILDSKKSEDIAQVIVEFTGRCKVKIRRHDHYTTVSVHPMHRESSHLRQAPRSHIAREGTTSDCDFFFMMEVATPFRVVPVVGHSASEFLSKQKARIQDCNAHQASANWIRLEC